MKITSICALIILASLHLSCNKKGCTDKTASNFDPEAKKADNTCTYEGSVVFWYNEQTSQEMLLMGMTTVKYFLDNQLIGSTSADVYFTGAPDCGQNGSITVTRQLGGTKGKAFEYRIEDQAGLERKKGIINLEGGACVRHQLDF